MNKKTLEKLGIVYPENKVDWIIYFDEKNKSVSCIPVGSKMAAHLDVPMIKGFRGTMAEALKEVRRISNDYSNTNRQKRRLHADKQ